MCRERQLVKFAPKLYICNIPVSQQASFPWRETVARTLLSGGLCISVSSHCRARHTY